MAAPSTSHALGTGAPVADAPFDQEGLFTLLDGYADILESMITVFRANASTLLAEIHGAQARRDAPALAAAAHAMKGAVGCFLARPSIATSVRVEACARARDFTASARAIADLEVALARLMTALDRLEEEIAP